MTSSGKCNTCEKITGRYIAQLKVWRCDQCYKYEEVKSFEEDEKSMFRLSKKIKPKSSKTPYGKRYF